MDRIRVLLADAQPLFSEALAIALGACPDLEVLDERPTSGREAVEAAVSLLPDVAALDCWMWDVDGIALTRRIRCEVPEVKVVLLSWFHGARDIRGALEAGAAAFLPKSLTVAEVASAIRRVHAGESPVYAEELERLAKTIRRRDERAAAVWRRFAELTPREMDVLQLLSFGRHPEEIACELLISKATVRTHIHNILRKTGTRSQVECLALVRTYGLIQT